MTTEPERNSRCPLCAGHLGAGQADLPFIVKGKIVVVRHVQAEVCGDCGEPFLDATTTDSVTALVRDALSDQMELAVVDMSRESIAA